MLLTYRQLLLSQIQESRLILSFDPSNFELVPFYWYVWLHHGLSCNRFTIKCRPVDEDKLERVKPSKLLEYREQHHFRGPLCLCPLLRTLDEEPTSRSIEAAILLKRSGTYVGEYVAECANGHCGYLGQFPDPIAFQKNR
jgi:hypothetical protein